MNNIMNNEMLKLVAMICLLVGGIDLGLAGLTGHDLILSIFGHFLGRVIFIVIGVAAGFKGYLFYLKKMNKPA